MMVSQRTRRTREFTGPTPHSVAIRARPPNVRPPEHLILERRKKEEMLQEYKKNTQYMEFNDLKNEWERFTDRKIKINTTMRRVDGLMLANQFNVEDRRERLRTMLQQEEAAYLREMDEKEETVLERQAKMRERAKYLKDRRESERLEYVQEKYDQQFRNQCEELRSTLSKRQQDEVCAERLEQLKIKDVMDRERMEEDQMYARLWEEDRQKKADREERDAKAAQERNIETLSTLRTQMASLEEKKETALRLKEEEAQLLREQAALRQLEEQRNREEKLRLQQETRDMLDLSLKLKMKKRAKAEQEQLAFDLKILEQLLEESRNEAMEQLQRKRELREEDKRYREYLRNLMEEEKVKEVELERLINEEVEKMWQKRLDQWRLERQARKKLMEDVLHVRAQQIQDRLMTNDRKQREAEMERQELLRTIEENKILEQQKMEKNWNKNRSYQQDLRGQITYNNQLRELEFQREDEEFILGMQAEREYQARLKDCLDSPEYDKLHPMRRAMAARSAQQSRH
ncbi:cilia- and flagella-associated protein 53-like [Mizuhopecten yessoensis]|uniref:Cilia- and flagella-associated protein 53 n=1 Tax=Mizuhopecten yessoensis TaxID=6573 RepID=A0A210PEG0_MIZYE|nr:cilia- and flagella-associated protein 53-like [Mizuhopecten yessoensis]OWF34875.1 Coiled-coil domain-containing protein 11 [Mizuhopecten yessoensis]